ncbi:MAG: hypothetical protein WA958_13125 [Tunicatimonas sp.]
MLLTIIIAAALLLPLSVYLFKKVEEESDHTLIPADELEAFSADDPPIIVKQMRGGKVEQTLCYFLSPEVSPKNAVAKVDQRDPLFAKLQLDETIVIAP